jgi:DNA-directed RNA polymerase subunit RPC12/RpoP
MILQYKCPDCGADMTFDSTSGMLACSSCGRKDHIDNNSHTDNTAKNPEDSADDVDEVYGDFEEFESETGSSTFGEGEASQYQCNNCGAILITDPDTTATTCSFCGAAMVLGDRLSGSMAPAKVIPFSINKAQAQEAFKKWCKKGLLTPKGFMTADRIKNITGMYIPFWLYDLNGQGEAEATCTRVRTYTMGEYIYTETKFYDVFRKVDLDYERIPVDASEKMNDKLMDKLEPFHYTDLKDFNAPYLAGYIAEKYNYTDNDLFPRVKERTEGYVDSYIQSTISGYSTTTFHRKWIDVKQRKADYTLLPIWMICYDYKQSEHTFAMNGQTGKIVGKPPLSKGKIGLWFGGISGAIFIILKAIALYLGGGLL